MLSGDAEQLSEFFLSEHALGAEQLSESESKSRAVRAHVRRILLKIPSGRQAELVEPNGAQQRA